MKPQEIPPFISAAENQFYEAIKKVDLEQLSTNAILLKTQVDILKHLGLLPIEFTAMDLVQEMRKFRQGEK